MRDGEEFTAGDDDIIIARERKRTNHLSLKDFGQCKTTIKLTFGLKGLLSLLMDVDLSLKSQKQSGDWT